jgi:hypothetical protein
LTGTPASGCNRRARSSICGRKESDDD